MLDAIDLTGGVAALAALPNPVQLAAVSLDALRRIAASLAAPRRQSREACNGDVR